MDRRRTGIARTWAAALLLASGAAAPPADASTTAPGPTPADTSLALPGDGTGAVFGSLTVEGENRVQVTFARPVLNLDLDPSAAPGLVIDGPLDILDRSRPDPVKSLLGASALDRSPRTARPWLHAFDAGPVALFRAALTDVARWQLQVMDSTGRVVMVFAGQGPPPAEIAWDGRRLDGRPASCGLTYSFVMEAYDRAGNKRRIVGDGFELPAYRLAGDGGPVLLTAGGDWAADDDRTLILALEVASRLNLGTSPMTPLVLTVVARSLQTAEDLGRRVADLVTPLLIGPPDRLSVLCEAAPEAPVGGALHLAPRPAP